MGARLTAQVRHAASQCADQMDLGPLGSIPPGPGRDGLTRTVAWRLGINRAQVALELGTLWNDTVGRQGGRVAGSDQAEASDVTARGNQDTSPLATLIRQLAEMPEPKPRAAARRPARKLDSPEAIQAALNGAAAKTISDTQLYSHGSRVSQDNAAFDRQFSGTSFGNYAAVDFSKIDPKDPVLDMPIYRGMSSEDPAVHAMLLTGKLVPQGRSGDYEGFKTYGHKSPIDAYEWSLDPYIALKGAGGHGYLVQTTLRDLKDALPPHCVARKVGDTEGGLFISAPVEPRVKSVVHVSGTYALGAVQPKVRGPNAGKLADHLQARVPGHGGWDEYLDSGLKGATILKRAHLRETRRQIDHWCQRLLELQPDSTLPAKVRQRVARADEKGSPSAAIRCAKEQLGNLKLRVVCLEDDGRGEPDDGVYRIDL